MHEPVRPVGIARFRLLLAPATAVLVALPGVGFLAVTLLFFPPLAGLVGLGGLALAGIGGFVAALLRPGPWVERSAAVVWLGLLPVAGFVVDAVLMEPCTTPCGTDYQPLAWPGAWGVLGSYGLGLLAFAVAWRRPAPLPAHQEAALLLAMAQAVATCALTAVHFGQSVVVAPFMPPVVSPTISSLVLAGGLLQRLARAGAVAAGASASLGTVGLGAWAVLSGVLQGTFRPFGGAMADTCGYTFSQMTPPPGDCHYLCTVAAQGHPWLVRPLRMGTRRGRPIVVNRQLAAANAFEDLLHERWPRFGAWARRTYDRWGRDVTRFLLRRWAADLVFVAMLPAQAAFELALLLLDPGDPEARMDRMYRPRG